MKCINWEEKNMIIVLLYRTMKFENEYASIPIWHIQNFKWIKSKIKHIGTLWLNYHHVNRKRWSPKYKRVNIYYNLWIMNWMLRMISCLAIGSLICLSSVWKYKHFPYNKWDIYFEKHISRNVLSCNRSRVFTHHLAKLK